MLRNVKAGDWIFTIQNGWEKVGSINVSADYPIKAKEDSYTLGGKKYIADSYPSAWTYNPFNPEDQPPVEFQVGEVIAVRDSKEDGWDYEEFKRLEPKGKYPYIGTYLCTQNYWRYARKLTPAEKGE